MCWRPICLSGVNPNHLYSSQCMTDPTLLGIFLYFFSVTLLHIFTMFTVLSFSIKRWQIFCLFMLYYNSPFYEVVSDFVSLFRCLLCNHIIYDRFLNSSWWYFLFVFVLSLGAFVTCNYAISSLINVVYFTVPPSFNMIPLFL